MQNKFRAAILAFLLLNLSFLTQLQAQNLPPLTHGLTAMKDMPPAPALGFLNLDDEVVDMPGLAGKVVVVNFWATWCPPCRREMGSMERLYQATRDSNVEVLAVNIGEDLDTVFSFLGTIEPSPNFPILLDTDAVSMSRWKVRGLPTTFIVDGTGKIVYRAVGGREFDHPEIQETLLRLAR